jgi:membrane protein required for colicin V production
MIFDLVVIGVVLGAIALGGWKGFAWQVAGIVSLVAGFVVAIPLSKPLAPIFGHSEPLNRFVALAVLYICVSLGIYIVALVYRKTLERWQLHHWDKHLGAVMGGMKGILLCMTLTFFAITLFRSLRDPIFNTKTGRLMGRAMMGLHPVLPEEVHDVIHPYIHHLDEPGDPPADEHEPDHHH